MNRRIQNPVLRTLVFLITLITACTHAMAGEERKVVVYTALDRQFSEPIFKKFEDDTGIKVLPKYDTESTKTVGLTNAIRAEKDRPRCDVFWNNEIVNTIRLKQEGLLSPVHVCKVHDFPAIYKDPEECWYGFAARARIILINTNLVSPEKEPTSIYDFHDPQWRGNCAIAKPLFGTTATHAACLFSSLGMEKAKEYFEKLIQNEIRIEASNSQCAKKVAEGKMAMCLTDTDDAMVQILAGKPVKIIYPDTQEGQMGMLYIPNTLSIIKNAPHRKEAEILINYLLSPEVEIALAQCPSAQIPVNPNIKIEMRVKTPNQVKLMSVDFNEAAEIFSTAAEYIKESFLR